MPQRFNTLYLLVFKKWLKPKCVNYNPALTCMIESTQIGSQKVLSGLIKIKPPTKLLVKLFIVPL